MSAARRLGRVLGALAIAAATVIGTAHAAVAADELGTGWGGDTVNLAWDGETYTTATESFVGVPVAVPGDRAYRTLVVTNDGPSAGVLRAWVVDVELDGPSGTGSRFFDDLTVDWSGEGAASSASLRSLATAGSTPLARVELGAGESTELIVGYRFPVTSTAGNAKDDGELTARFDVLLRIEGDLDDDGDDPGDGDGTGDGDEPGDDDGSPDDGDDPGDDGDDDGGDDDGNDDTDRDDGSPDDDGELPETGVTVERTVLVALLLVIGGMLLVFLTRRRDRSQE